MSSHELATFSDSRIDGIAVVSVTGELDISNKHEFRQVLDEGLGAAADRFIVDLRQVTYMDSTGIGGLIGLLKHANETGKSVSLVIEENSALQHLFKIAGIHDAFDISHTLEDAADSVAEEKEPRIEPRAS